MTTQERERNKDNSRRYLALRRGAGPHGSHASRRGASTNPLSCGSHVSGAHRGQYGATGEEPTAMQRAWAAALAKQAEGK